MKISETTRYLAAYLIDHKGQFIEHIDEYGVIFDLRDLENLIQEFYDSQP